MLVSPAKHLSIYKYLYCLMVNKTLVSPGFSVKRNQLSARLGFCVAKSCSDGAKGVARGVPGIYMERSRTSGAQWCGDSGRAIACITYFAQARSAQNATPVFTS
jgi:hypothetical protein